MRFDDGRSSKIRQSVLQLPVLLSDHTPRRSLPYVDVYLLAATWDERCLNFLREVISVFAQVSNFLWDTKFRVEVHSIAFRNSDYEPSWKLLLYIDPIHSG